MSDNSKLKNDIYDFIKARHSSVTFTELARHVKGFSGDMGMKLRENLLICCNISPAAIECLDDLVMNKLIYVQMASPTLYLHEGGLPDLPIAKKVMTYKEPHFLPVTFGIVVTEPKNS